MSRLEDSTLTPGGWKLILDGPNAGCYNMAVDEVLLNQVSNQADLPVTYVRFFQWDKATLSLGFSQKVARAVNLDFCKRKKIDLVRRITGGKAVLHDREITYSVVSNDPYFFPLRDIVETYKLIALALRLGFKAMGLDTQLASRAIRPAALKEKSSSACFAISHHYEILCRGRKLVGSAQRRTKSAFLQHGSILLEFDPVQLANAISCQDHLNLDLQVTSLARCLGYTPTPAEVMAHLQKAFQDFFNIRFELIGMSGSPLQDVAEKLSRSKYAFVDWSRSAGTTASIGRMSLGGSQQHQRPGM